MGSESAGSTGRPCGRLASGCVEFGERSVEVEAMEGLGDGDEGDARVGKAPWPGHPPVVLIDRSCKARCVPLLN